MITNQEYEQIAKTIIDHLGGYGKLASMIGVQHYIPIREGRGGVTFQFKGNRKMNVVHIRLNANDLYDLHFERWTLKSITDKGKIEDISNDSLKSDFENHTQLYLSL